MTACCLDCKRNRDCPKYPGGKWNDTEVHEKGCEYFKAAWIRRRSDYA